MIFVAKMLVAFAILMVSTLGMAASIKAPIPDANTFTPAHVGEMTYYDPSESGNEVACGGHYLPTDRIAALGAGSFGSRAACGKTAIISLNGNTTTATIVDMCDAGAPDDIDVTPVVFEDLAPTPSGRVPGVAWQMS
ncbi:hypothetical protein Daus18300_006210 [Diaporthe australafricana]|uniref:RlpA-like protein double-psi beta-barrel domain-containing protein n=1 Tax=Diaporthe australafricana TaxID=127596 RepID=A0ABR3WVG4_9PEZI